MTRFLTFLTALVLYGVVAFAAAMLLGRLLKYNEQKYLRPGLTPEPKTEPEPEPEPVLKLNAKTYVLEIHRDKTFRIVEKRLYLHGNPARKKAIRNYANHHCVLYEDMGRRWVEIQRWSPMPK